mgnify:CR=1 FL=1
MKAKNNAPGDWNPMGAACEMQAQDTTLRDDLRFAWEAMGLRDAFAGMAPRDFAKAALGAALLVAGLIGIALMG